MDSFAAFILTHGRPDNVKTYETLRARGYKGRIYLIVDDLDEALPRYREVFGDQVLVFDKKATAQRVDTGDNFKRLDTVLFARHACFDLAQELGLSHFIQLDDDYTYFEYRFDDRLDYATGRGVFSLDKIFGALVGFLESSGAATIALAQGGDFIGGRHNSKFGKMPTLRRKAMNSFVCKADKPVDFVARMNDDVTTYVVGGSRGSLFFTANQVSLTQVTTQQNTGGLTAMYLDAGTYVKSFYSILFQPSSVRIESMGDKHMRLHHRIEWKHTTPMILDEKHRRHRG
tara:strand:- start:1076 stop:1936 length:861 start_codon:yes stop_codon:yes gene_type:complete